MFVVHNLTTRTIILSDLRVEIGPRKILDLERVADRSAIDGSRDLKKAIADRRLALTRHSIIQVDKPVPKPAPQVIERTTVQKVDEEQLAKLIKQTIAEELRNQPPQSQPQADIEDTIQKAIVSNMGGLVSSIRDQINNIRIEKPDKEVEELPIDPKQFAEISQKSVQKISDEIETGGQNKAKQIRISNKKSASDLANELD
jgi:hypothetical protein